MRNAVQELSIGRPLSLSPLCLTIKECCTFNLGSLIQALAAGACYPLPSSASYTESLSALESELLAIVRNMPVRNSHAYGSYNSHDRCGPGPSLQAKITEATTTTAFVLTSAQAKRLEQQARRSGIINKMLLGSK